MSATDPPTFPIRPYNRPALPRLGYRLGAYADIADAMLRQINASTELIRWTHRAPDDPGIAIIESAAIVADILTFYQQHYANEAFLRTAQWRESVQELVRLTGYRLAPGLAGRTKFALEVRGSRPVVVPAAFPVKAELEGAPDVVDFQTSAEHTAIPHLSKFHLYRARQYSAGLAAGSSSFEIVRVDNSADPAGLAGLDVKTGDKLMLVPPEPSWTTAGALSPAQAAPQVVKVKKITQRLGRYIVEIETPLLASWSSNVSAYRLGRTFRHFGHNAPPKRHQSIKSGSEVTGTREFDTNFQRHLDHNCAQQDTTISLPPNFMPLDQEVSDLVPRSTLIVQTPVTFNTTRRELCVVRRINAVSAGPIGLGDMNGSATFLTLNSPPVSNSSQGRPQVDLRDFRFIEATSARLELTRTPSHPGGNFTDSDQLFFYGPTSEAAGLVSRALIFKADDGRFAEALAASVDRSSPSWARLRRVTLNAAPKGFTRANFDEEKPTVTVYGNIVEVTQGKAEKMVVLGNGDAREMFQTFKIPKAPLTYLHTASATPPHVPELTIRVNGREWAQVDSFFARGPLEEIYVVREDAEGMSYVQFGDGENGARLPSGVQNVTATYRSGLGALGLVKEGAKPSAGNRIDGLEKVQLPGEVTGGAQAEHPDKAREAAPGKLQTLGRMVSLKDYESEALSTAGVVAAAAAWDIADGSPAISLRILLEQAQQSDTQFEAVAEILRASDRARGPDRYPTEVTQCELRYVYLTVSYGHDPALRREDVDAALRSALGLAGDDANARTGLFGLRRRRLGEREYILRIEGVLQNVLGISSCRVVHFNRLPLGNDPALLTIPSIRARVPSVMCNPTEMLQLHAQHLALMPTANT
jgi:predicted phage baseplate assembly protein